MLWNKKNKDVNIQCTANALMLHIKNTVISHRGHCWKSRGELYYRSNRTSETALKVKVWQLWKISLIQWFCWIVSYWAMIKYSECIRQEGLNKETGVSHAVRCTSNFMFSIMILTEDLYCRMKIMSDGGMEQARNNISVCLPAADFYLQYLLHLIHIQFKQFKIIKIRLYIWDPGPQNQS